MKISEKEKNLITSLVRTQDQNAHLLGVSAIQFFETLNSILEKVKNTREKQKNLGEAILRSHGIDVDSGEYTIDTSTREVKKLVVVDGQAKYILIPEEESKESKEDKKV